MMINEIIDSRKYLPVNQQRAESIDKSLASGKSSFSDTLQEFVHDVNDLQHESSRMNERMIAGENVDLHDVMIAGEKAKTSFNLLMELRNKGLDLYREAIRIQI